MQEALGSCLTNKYSEGYPGARLVNSVSEHFKSVSAVFQLYTCNGSCANFVPVCLTSTDRTVLVVTSVKQPLVNNSVILQLPFV